MKNKEDETFRERYERYEEIADKKYDIYEELEEKISMLERELEILRIRRESAYNTWVHWLNKHKEEVKPEDLERYLEIRREKLIEGMSYPLASEYAYNTLYGEE